MVTQIEQHILIECNLNWSYSSRYYTNIQRLL